MAYTAKQAINTFFQYLGIDENNVEFIDGTDKRGILYEDVVIFIYPIGCKVKDGNVKQSWIDTRDSGVNQRKNAWKYSVDNNRKYFCMAVNDEREIYNDIILVLESSEDYISKVTHRDEGGTQTNIPNGFTLNMENGFKREKTPNGFYLSAVHKDNIKTYIEYNDNRIYLELENKSEDKEIVYNTNLNSKFSRNRILFGAPGTGKSFKMDEQKDEILKGSNGKFERVTFHPEYSYAHFVGTYKPVPTIDSDGKDSITYKYVPGPFMRMLVNALKNTKEETQSPYVLLIEEINRANVAAVFGEVFQLLDRNSDGVSEYSIQTSEDMKKYLYEQLHEELGGELNDYSSIKIPNNMFIWATMNSPDQGVFPMDTAFKRRWDFTYIGINENENKVKDYNFKINNNDINWNNLRKSINKFLLSNRINEDKLMGPYFLSAKVLGGDSENFIKAVENKVLMYLFDDAAKQRRSDLFNGIEETKRNIYSEVCSEFRKKGINIFNKQVVDEIKKLDEETNIYKEHDINIHNTEQSYRLSVADPENTYSNSGE